MRGRARRRPSRGAARPLSSRRSCPRRPPDRRSPEPHTRGVSSPAITLDATRAPRAPRGGRIHGPPLLSPAPAPRVTRERPAAQIADDRLYLKGEHLQKTGSFKARAALARISSLTPAER